MNSRESVNTISPTLYAFLIKMAEIHMVLPNLAFRRPPRPPPVPLSREDLKQRCPEPPVRRFVWTKYTQSGFPYRVNHATVAYTDCSGRRLMLSVGGYHNEDRHNRNAVAEEDEEEFSPTFRTGPIDMHCMDVGENFLSRWVLPLLLVVWLFVGRVIVLVVS